MVVAMNSELTTASAVASTAASNRAPIRSSPMTREGDRRVGRSWQPRRRAEGDHDLAAAVGGVRADLRQAESASQREALALPGAQRGVGGDDDDARSGTVLDRHQVADLAADRHAVDDEAVAQAEVAQDEGAERVRAARRSRSTRDEVPMPALKSKAVMPVPAPTQPSATGPPVAPSSAA